MAINNTVLNGRLGADAEGRELDGDTYLSSFSMANTRKFKGRDGKQQEETLWMRCSWFGNGARALNEYLTKGREVTVRGRLVENKWVDKDSGENRSRIELRVEELTLHGNGESTGGDTPPAKKSNAAKRASARANYDDVDDASEKMPWEED